MERTNIQALFAPGFAPPISATTYKVAILRIDFSDNTMTKTKAQTESLFTNHKNFYLENSYNLVTVTATVTNGGAGAEGSFRMPQTHSYYASGISSKYSELALDAIAVATTAGFNFSSYDHLMIYHAGAGAETTSNSNIWSVYFSNIAGGPAASGKTFPGVTFVPERESGTIDPLGVICHEYGHQLGLPDLYNTGTSPSSNVVGVWSLMDYGIYLGDPVGSKPAHMDPWSKQFLGFSSPQTISFTQELSTSITQSETTRNGFFRIPIPASDVGGENEYFMLEYRRTGGASYDTALPGQGLLIWHVDDSIASNSTRLNANNINADSTRKGVELVEADSSDPSTNQGDAGDPWPGTANNSHFQSPKSNAYNGKDSGVEVSNISSPGSSSISLLLKTPFNNPAIVRNTTPGSVVITGGVQGYANPNLGEGTLFGIRPSQSGAVTLKIYTLNGDLVWETNSSVTAGSQTVLRWNSLNSDGNTVSSGIYIVTIEGGGIETKRMVAIAR
ncbi:MAG: M6 family metalloprotease domain-containing protein [Elusimicrobia bacterium]|nr:M6 family metalloprotease domain-containing protein [Elusimicrobiota bacterium]